MGENKHKNIKYDNTRFLPDSDNIIHVLQFPLLSVPLQSIHKVFTNLLILLSLSNNTDISENTELLI